MTLTELTQLEENVIFTYSQIHVVEDGKTANEKFFVGPLPKIGQAVEMVYVGDGPLGQMNFQLRTKENQTRTPMTDA